MDRHVVRMRAALAMLVALDGDDMDSSQAIVEEMVEAQSLSALVAGLSAITLTLADELVRGEMAESPEAVWEWIGDQLNILEAQSYE